MSSWSNWYRLGKKWTYDWLDKSQRGEWSKNDQDIYDFVSSVPVLNHFTSLYEKEKTREWYLDRYGIDYSEITQPWNVPGGSELGSVNGGLNFVSENVTRLYKDYRSDLDRKNREYRAELKRLYRASRHRW